MNNRGWIISIILILLSLVACREERGHREIASAPTATVPAVILPVRQSNFVDLAELSSDPSRYEGASIQVSGRFQPLPRLLCQQGLRRSPATWQLTEGEYTIQADGGFEQLLRPFAGQELDLTVQGRWLRWSGPVGCGKRAVQRQIWYLQVTEIISPNPIVRTANLPGLVATTAKPTVPTSTIPPTPTEPPDSATPTVIPGEIATEVIDPATTATTVPTTPAATATISVSATITGTPAVAPTPSGTLTGTPVGNVTPAPGATGTATPVGNVTPTPGATGTATPTTTGGLGPTPTPAAAETVDQDVLEPQSVGKSSFVASETHRWYFDLSATDTVTISVAPAISRDIQFSVIGPNGTVIVERNQAPAGQPETIVGLELAQTGRYSILVRDLNGAPGPYAVLFLRSQSYTFLFQPTLQYGDNPASSLAADNDHFWNFTAAPGDRVTIRVTPDNQASEMYVELYGPEMTLINCPVVNTGSTIITKEIQNCLLEEGGFYTIRVGEFNFDPANYDIFLTQS